MYAVLILHVPTSMANEYVASNLASFNIEGSASSSEILNSLQTGVSLVSEKVGFQIVSTR